MKRRLDLRIRPPAKLSPAKRARDPIEPVNFCNLDPDEVLVGVPADATVPVACREALTLYATRPILRKAGVGAVYVIAKSRMDEIEHLAGTNALHVSQCCRTTFRLTPDLRYLESVAGVCPRCLRETTFEKSGVAAKSAPAERVIADVANDVPEIRKEDRCHDRVVR